MTRRKKAGDTDPPEKLKLIDCVPAAPAHIETPQWRDAEGNMHMTEGDARDENMLIVIKKIIEHADKEQRFIGRDGAPEDIADFIVRYRCELIVALCAHGEKGGEDSDNVTKAFADYMNGKFGNNWSHGNTEHRAVVHGMREAFIAGQAWYVHKR